MKETGEPKEPSAWRLLKRVEGLVEATHMRGKLGIREAGGLLAVDSLGKVAMKKGILDVHLGIGQGLAVAMLRTTRIVAGLTTGLNVSP